MMNKEIAAPNIVYIFTDQQFADAMSCAGNEDLKTPAMDRIAETGVRFPNAYCAYPLCTPSRAAMFTGLLPHESGIDKNNLRLSSEQVADSLGSVLGRAGYHTIYHGKWHIPEYNIPADQGFAEVGTFGDSHVADDCIQSIQSAPEDKPFFLVASLDNPHNICEWSRGQNLPWGNVAEDPIEACPALPENLDTPHMPEALMTEQESQPRLFLGAKYPDHYWRFYRQAYYDLVEKVDREIGKILDVLDDNTVVIFASDHGDGLGAHRWNQKWALYEESVRVPFIIADPDSARRGQVDEALVNAGIDFYATVCDYANAPLPEGRRGKSLKDRVRDAKTPEPRDSVVVETKFEMNNWTDGRALRAGCYKYIVYSWGRGREELYNLEDDPLETRNLAREKEFDNIIDAFRQKMIDWCDTIGDKFKRLACIAPGERRERDRM